MIPTVALNGLTYPDWLIRLCAFRRVAVALDADKAGDEVAEALTKRLRSVGASVERWRPEDAKDWNETVTGIDVPFKVLDEAG